MPSSTHMDIMSAKTPDEFLAHMVKYANNLGFATCDTTVFVEHEDRERDIIVVDNLPRSDEWRQLGHLGKRCPVMQHCKYHSTAVAWGSRTYARPEISDLYDVCSGLGLRSGISVAMHLPDKSMAQFSVHADVDLPADAHAVATSDLQHFAAHAFVSAANLFLKVDSDGLRQRLTLVEREALRWSLDESGSDETSRHLRISEDETRRVLAVATKTLGCPTPRAAALRALGLGII